MKQYKATVRITLWVDVEFEAAGHLDALGKAEDEADAQVTARLLVGQDIVKRSCVRGSVKEIEKDLGSGA